MNDNEKKIVKPQNVEYDANLINNNDTMLNRERANIVSATIKANEELDEKKALKVNNEIKVKKMHPVIRFIIVIIMLLVAGVLTYLAFLLVKTTYELDNEKTTTTTTKLSEKSRIFKYLNNMESLRKFQDNSSILLLSPKGYDLVNGNNYYLFIDYDESGIKNTTYGTYSLIDEEIKLNSINAGENTYKISEDGILFNGSILKLFDSEMKYYANNSKNESELLIINGTIKGEYAIYITSDSTTTNVITSSYKEDDNQIELDTGLVFPKKDISVKGKYFDLKLIS